jgi:hypothetical protein
VKAEALVVGESGKGKDMLGRRAAWMVGLGNMTGYRIGEGKWGEATRRRNVDTHVNETAARNPRIRGLVV